MDGRISFHKLTITISASEAQKRLFSFEKFLIICPTTVLLLFGERVVYRLADVVQTFFAMASAMSLSS